MHRLVGILRVLGTAGISCSRLAGLIVTASLAGDLCFAQVAPGTISGTKLVIHGDVIEFGLKQGIAGVKVTLDRWDGKPVSSFVPRTRTGEQETNSSGEFSFSVEAEGSYRIEVRKDGYVLPGTTLDGYSSSAEVKLDKTHRTAESHFVLARPGEVTGRVVDYYTKGAVVGLQVYVAQSTYSRGRQLLWAGNTAITGADGRFVVSGVAPANYVVVPLPRLVDDASMKAFPELQQSAENRTLTDLVAKDFEVVDDDYETTYWPGGGELNEAVPVMVVSGTSADIGTLNIRKVPKYRVRVSVLGGMCAPGDTISLHFTLPDKPWETVGGLARTPCGKDVMVRGFAPGEYRIEVSLSHDKGEVMRGSMQFSVVDRNVFITVPVADGITLPGKIIFADGASKADVSGIRLLFFPVGWALENAPPAIASDGAFEVPRMQSRDYNIKISGVPATHYIREIRYNGHVLSDTMFSMAPEVQTQSLEIVLDDKPATVAGQVTDHDGPVTQPHVILVHLPLNGMDPFSSVEETDGDENGMYSFRGVTPGDYRIMAVPRGATRTIEGPHVLERTLSAATALSLKEAQFRSVNLELANP